MNWKARYREPRSGSRVRVKYTSQHRKYSIYSPYKDGDIITLGKIYLKDSKERWWDIKEDDSLGIEEKDFEVIG